MANAPQTARTQQFVKIKDIKDGIVLLKDGGLRRILLVDGLNFDLKSDEEQNIITFAYQNFLNSLDFPIQIGIHSRKLNVEDYVKKLEKQQTEEQNDLLKPKI